MESIHKRLQEKVIGRGHRNHFCCPLFSLIEDEKLQTLKQELGKGACAAVTKALGELNEDNPSGRYPMTVLWNYEEDREATVAEAIHHIMKKLKTRKRKFHKKDCPI